MAEKNPKQQSPPMPDMSFIQLHVLLTVFVVSGVFFVLLLICSCGFFDKVPNRMAFFPFFFSPIFIFRNLFLVIPLWGASPWLPMQPSGPFV